ncbi:hypothetical protein M0811_05212 [Anaeramoeba ignava]|uniref:Fibronectin type-III domain-containing protein n=1 Tax=Anaeramoeba ignava TaxID=1746090 RepID=A0A9Q0LU47_ANAIG|nr:hypothetical protein M0811_05212 [Anaeramoeba ignava]
MKTTQKIFSIFCFFSFLFFLTSNSILQFELTSIDGQEGDNFGFSNAIEGNYAFIASPKATVGNNSEQGKVYIFQNNGTNWNQLSILTASDGQSGDEFGCSLAVSQNTLIVGAFSAGLWNSTNQGKAYIFQNNGTNWNQLSILIASDGQPYDNFGYSVGISGSNAIIGAFFASVNNQSQQGKAYIFGNNGSSWNQLSILTANDGQSGDQFGWSVSISGNYSIIGAPYASVGNNSAQGKAYIFGNNGSSWNQASILTASDGAYSDNFGYSVGISNSFGIVGSPKVVYPNTTNHGKGYIFNNNGTTWNQQQILVPTGVDNFSSFGVSCAISGNWIIYGSYGSSEVTNNSNGNAFVFFNNNSTWNQSCTLSPSDGKNGDHFATNVALDSSSFLVGAPHASVGNNLLQGKSYIFLPEILPPQVNIENCTSLFSKFSCTWDAIDISGIQYQILYDQFWINVVNPVQNGSFFSEIFSPPQYPNITGNLFYSIQMRACNPILNICGNSSSSWNLTTRIDSVQNLSLVSLPNISISVSWKSPHVPLVNSTPKLDHYLISYQSSSSPNATQMSLTNTTTSVLLQSNLTPSTNYSVSIWPCQDQQCSGQSQGEIATSFICTFFGPVLNLTCSLSNGENISCTWNPPTGSATPYDYQFVYSANSANDSGSFSPNITNQTFTAKFYTEEYTINVSACDQNGNCGPVSMFSINTSLPAPNMISWTYGIEEVELNFTKINGSQGYLISLDNKQTWENFDYINSNESYVYGVKKNVPGNVPFVSSIRACSESTCNLSLAGSPSSVFVLIAQLGNITSFDCDGEDDEIECKWHGLNLASGLGGYCFTLNSSTVYLNPNQHKFEQENLQVYQTYFVSVYASAFQNCSASNYSGIPNSKYVTLYPESESSSSGTKAGVIATAVVVPVVGVALIVGVVLILRKKRNRYKKFDDQSNQELMISDNEDYQREI